ncbi:PQQ repeat-containing protein [Corallococcus coralloides DSM 2259]|uniref:PQQ repeat-containing protein n=1 Tax=Corallococcus coralloides (strain ATCC 25202 / DSM 2259 / NBRC 100086 / M2) TaxID=1144275 RepID=H8N0H9_CORCM|nr:PQQ-binding-like beta-propeller repeat protein [Corallococcus coralloides]AFE05736.1 PQQ repeat-containing protein [Corallococcus coralloides DSM 2259]
MNVRILALVAVLLPAVGFSQANSWSVSPIPAAGETVARVVMEDASDLVLEVTNTSTNTSDSRVSEVSFVLPTGYQLLGGLPAEENPNWKVEYIDANERRITFQSTLGCVDAGRGLARNESARFVLSVVAPSNRATDSTTERLVGGTYARDQCDGRSYSYNVNNMTPWTRGILAASVTLSPRVLAVNGTTVARVVVENRGTGSATVAVDNPASTSSVPLTTVNKDGNKAVAVRAAGVFVATLRPTAAGAVAARVRARTSNNASNAPLTDSPVTDVGNLVAAPDMDIVDAFAGDQVTLRLTVLNTSTTNTYTQVRPRTPVLLGRATASLVAGPSPESVAQLAPGASAQFTWRYQVSGTPGASYQFQAQVDGTLNGSAVAGDAVTARKGRIVEHRVRLSQETMSTAATGVTVAYTVQNRGTLPIYEVKLFRPAVNYFAVAASGPQAFGDWIVYTDAAGYLWESGTGIPVGGEATFRITYSGFTAVTADTAFRHRLELNQGWNDPRIRVEATMTLLSVAASPDVGRLTGVARDGSVTLTWDNPFNHGGTLVLRAEGTSPPNTAPTSGVRYAVGDVLGNATVAYVDEFSSASSMTDTAVTNGTTYTYRVFNADDQLRYGPGNQPTSQGLLATPRARVAGNPLWCYSVGLDATLQPVTELGVGIFSSFNDSVVATRTNTTNPSEDGAERFRPVKMAGKIATRFPVVPLLGRPGQQWIVVGDQTGVPAVLNAATGEFLWRNTTLGLGNISSFPVTQLLDYANPEYRTTYSNVDLAIFATRNTSAQNQVVALNAATGALIWRYRPGDLGMVSGGMLVDYTTNRLYVPTRSGTSAATLRVLNSLTGAEVARLSLGDLEFGVVRNATSNQILVTANDGKVHGVNPTTFTTAWTVTVRSNMVPAFTQFARPQGRGFVVPTEDNKVERYEVVEAHGTGVPELLWSKPIAARPAGLFTLNLNGVVRVYVGAADGKVHQFELETGTETGQVTVGSAQKIGVPTIDHTVGRLHVGTEDGRICAFPVPF